MVSPVTYIKRNTIDLPIEKLPFNEGKKVKLIDFSNLRVILSCSKFPHDLGALCFTKRKRQQNHPNQKGYTIWEVNPKTLLNDRKMVIQKFSKFIYTLHRFGKRSKTIFNHVNVFISFTLWCDQNYPNVFSSSANVRNAYYLYTQMLRTQIKTNSLHVNSAAIKQRLIRKILNAIYENRHGELTAGITKIHVNKFAANVTTPPSELVAQQATSLFTHIFRNISKFILNDTQYPFRMQLPEESVWIFPGQVAFATKSMLDKRHEWKQGFWSWDYENGVISKPESIQQYYSKPGSANQAVKNSKALLKDANINNHHRARIDLACLAIQCFAMLFIANTGMNLAPLCQLPWDTINDFESNKSIKQGFRAVKHRAGGRSVEFHITDHFLPYFQQYLQLRKWFLQGREAPLFFRIDKKGTLEKIDETLVIKLRIKLEKFNLILPSARQWRAYKSDWLIRTSDIATAALLLQNSKQTVVQHYMAGSKIQADNEMSEFLKSLHFKIVHSNNIIKHDINIGHCQEHGVPEIDHPQSVIQPDCLQPEGCLFCVKYKVHTDEHDIRKLFSCRYVITETRTLASSELHFENIFGKVIKRIDALLAAIGSKNKVLNKTVERIKNEVQKEGKLTVYWASKLQILTELAVI